MPNFLHPVNNRITDPKNNLKNINSVLLFVGLILLFMYFLKSYLITLFLAIVIAMMMHPLYMKLFRLLGKKWIAIILCMLLLFSILAIVGLLFGIQLNIIINDWENISTKAGENMDLLQKWIHQHIGITPNDQMIRVKDFMKSIPSTAAGYVETLSTGLASFTLMFVYIVLIFIEKERFIKYIMYLFPTKDRGNALEVITEASQVAGNFLKSQLLSMLILFGIYVIGFWIGNVPYFLFLALLAAVFSIIPFIGNLLGGSIAFLMALTAAGLPSGVAVIIVMFIGQLTENYIIQPVIMGDNLNLNPFVTITSVIFFTFLWGPVGAILALPITGIIRVIFKHIPALEPWNYMISRNPRLNQEADEEEPEVEKEKPEESLPKTPEEAVIQLKNDQEANQAPKE